MPSAAAAAGPVVAGSATTGRRRLPAGQAPSSTRPPSPGPSTTATIINSQQSGNKQAAAPARHPSRGDEGRMAIVESGAVSRPPLRAIQPPSRPRWLVPTPMRAARTETGAASRPPLHAIQTPRKGLGARAAASPFLGGTKSLRKMGAGSKEVSKAQEPFHSNALPFEDDQTLNGDKGLTMHEGPKLSVDNLAVIIPDHLQVSNADYAHLTFGSFVSETLDAFLTTKSLGGHGDVATVPNDHSIDPPDVSNIIQADAENTTSQPPSQVQHGWGGIPGRPSMAEIVKMGRPQAKVGRGPVASSTAMPAIGDSVISNTSNHTPKEYSKTVFASEIGHGATDKLPDGATEVSVPKDATSVNMLPLVEGTDVEASSMSAEAQGSSTLDIKDGGIEKDTNLEECNTENLTVSGQFSASGKDIQSEYTEVTTHQDDGSIEKKDNFQSTDLPFDDNQNLNGDMCTTAKQIDHLTLHEGPKLSDDNPAVIIPDHLQADLNYSDQDLEKILYSWVLEGNSHNVSVLNIYAFEPEELGHNSIFLMKLEEAKNSSKTDIKYNRMLPSGRKWRKSYEVKNTSCKYARKVKYIYCEGSEKSKLKINMYEYALIDGPKDHVLCHILYDARSEILRKKQKKSSKNAPQIPEDGEDIDDEIVSQQEAIIAKEEELWKEVEWLRVELKQVRDNRDHSVSQLNSLNIELAKSSKERERLRKKVSELEDTCNRQHEQIQTFEKQLAVATEKLKATCYRQHEQIQALEKQLAVAAEKLKLADAIAVEAMTASEKQNEKIKYLEERLAHSESIIVEGDKFRKKLHNTILELKGNIRVFCRVRPLVGHDGPESAFISFPTSVESDGRGIEVIKKGQNHPFSFDKVFDQNASQEDVFVEVSQLVQSSLDGYKVCIFAYGQTGSGKTYTMLGKARVDEKGIIPRSLEQIFKTIHSLESQGWIYSVKVSMLEIYNEAIHDLLAPGRSSNVEMTRSKYSIMHDPRGNTTVSDLTIVDVFGIVDATSLLERALQIRSVGKTQMNEQSSRSHFVCTLKIFGSNQTAGQHVQGVLNLIDLAGSERLAKSRSTGDCMKETQSINKSLSALGDAICAITKGDNHVPFRNSKLTYLLQPCLGGDSKTLMFVNISPEATSVGETIEALRFASRVNSCEIGIPRRQIQARSFD